MTIHARTPPQSLFDLADTPTAWCGQPLGADHRTARAVEREAAYIVDGEIRKTGQILHGYEGLTCPDCKARQVANIDASWAQIKALLRGPE